MLKKDAAAGVDGVTWHAYAQGLDGRLADLHGRVHAGTYRATPSRRVYLPKPDGGTRPLGIAALEDKIVQKAVVETILTPIYEAEFLGFSYGFRPGRGLPREETPSTRAWSKASMKARIWSAVASLGERPRRRADGSGSDRPSPRDRTSTASAPCARGTHPVETRTAPSASSCQ